MRLVVNLFTHTNTRIDRECMDCSEITTSPMPLTCLVKMRQARGLVTMSAVFSVPTMCHVKCFIFNVEAYEGVANVDVFCFAMI